MDIINTKKTFGGGINSDDSPKLLGEGQVLNLMNGRVSVSEDGRNIRLESIKGTSLVSAPDIFPAGTHQTIGSTVDAYKNRLIWCNWNSTGEHGIYCYEKSNGSVWKVLLNSQVDTGLNFSKNKRIDRNIKVVGGMLYFNDGTENGQRKINIDAGIKRNHPSYNTTVAAYPNVLKFSEITLIKPPPALAPSIQKDTDSVFTNNFVATESFSFAFQYIYKDNEKSVIGAYSPASRYNKFNETNNRIVVKMNSDETIPPTVRIVRLIARVGNVAFVPKSWDVNVATEATEINNHNSNTASLQYNFYNDNTGEFIASSDILKPFDSVPRATRTIEVAKDRLFLGNNKDGYNTPTSTSLAFNFTASPVSATGRLKQPIKVKIYWQDPYRNYSAWYVYLSKTEVNPEGYYVILSTETYVPPTNPFPPFPVAPTTVAVSGLEWRGATQHEIGDVLNVKYGNLGGTIFPEYTFTTSTVTVTGIDPFVQDVFKSKSQYQVGIVFYDFAMRKCGVVKSPNIISIPARDYNYLNGVQAINISITNVNAFAEIPDWAYYYSFVRTLNLKTRFFIQSFDNAVRYATKDSKGEYVFEQKTFVTGAVAVAVDTTALVQSGLGYTYTEGDVCYLIKSSSTSFNIPYELPVIGQSGKYILLKATDIGDTSTVTAMYEIYTPYKASEQEPFFEFGHIYKVVNPTTIQRNYSVLNEVLLPDAYVLTRNYMATSYFAEAMNPNDLFYKKWENDTGKVNYITKLGEVLKTQSIYYSNTFLEGTAVNGLHTFEALNQKNLPLEMGEIFKLQLASKVQEEGSVMLAICRSQTASIYLGETQLVASSKNAYVAQSEGVIGTVNPLKGSCGTVNPETVIEYLGVVFWIDINTRQVVQYSANGLDAANKFKMVRFFQKFCKDYSVMNPADIDTLNGFHHIPTAIDPSFRREFLVVTPALADQGYLGNIPSYNPVVKNRFDVYDKQAKAVGLSVEKNVWGDTYEYSGEWYEYMNGEMYGFSGGLLYLHDSNASAYNTFYGIQHKMRVCVSLNELLSADRELANIAVEGNLPPDFTLAYSDNPDEQVTDLVFDDYQKKGTTWYAKFLRDRLSPSVIGSPDDKLFIGDVLTGYPLKVMLEWNVNDKLVYVDAVNVGFLVSKGLTQIIQK